MVFSKVSDIKGREPLVDYPWCSEVDRLLHWLSDKDPHVKAFCFDMVMSAAYIDAASGLERSIEKCSCAGNGFNAHLGFINLCSPCYVTNNTWSYQKAIKPQSGSLGKLSSEIILRFVKILYPKLMEVSAVGGTEVADAILKDKNGDEILAEVKSAPLLTYPFVFNIPNNCLNGEHEKVVITNSQLRGCESGMYFHDAGLVKLGKVGDDLWPFKSLINFIIDEKNSSFLQNCINEWVLARNAYSSRNRDDKVYYLTNACGNPPRIAKDRDGWPKKESISDSKTSAGMDRTDDIKKGIYQSLKIGITYPGVKTAIISNLPAYRHREEYVSPFVHMLWGLSEDLTEINGKKILSEDKLKRVFDFIITLEEPILRNTQL
jgi:hypothetical protein